MSRCLWREKMRSRRLTLFQGHVILTLGRTMYLAGANKIPVESRRMIQKFSPLELKGLVTLCYVMKTSRYTNSRRRNQRPQCSVLSFLGLVTPS